MGLTWMNNGFICKDLYAPFVLDKDSDYHDDLKKKYKIVLKQGSVPGILFRPFCMIFSYSNGHPDRSFWKKPHT